MPAGVGIGDLTRPSSLANSRMKYEKLEVAGVVKRVEAFISPPVRLDLQSLLQNPNTRTCLEGVESQYAVQDARMQQAEADQAALEGLFGSSTPCICPVRAGVLVERD